MPAWLSVYRSRQKDLARTGRTGERCPARKTWGVDALSLFLTLSLSLIILKCLFILGKRNCFVSSLQKSKEHTFERKKILFIEHHPDHAELIIDVLETKNVEKEINLMKDDCKLLIIFRKIGVG